MTKRHILIFNFICLGQNSNLTSGCIYLTGRFRTFMIFLEATSQCADVLPERPAKLRDSLAILERADLVLDLVELPRHPAVLLVHLNTFFQRHAGGHWLQQRRAETTGVTLNALLLRNEIRTVIRRQLHVPPRVSSLMYWSYWFYLTA